MKYYFQLQASRLCRYFRSMKIPPLIGITLGLILFVGFSKVLFLKLAYAGWIYLLILMALLIQLGESRRIGNLQNTFSKKQHFVLRMLENAAVCLPFQCFLWYEQAFIPALITIPLLFVFAFFKAKWPWSKSIPTPFKKLSFEFIVGFRKTFWIILLAYFLVFTSTQVENYNLGLFAIAMIMITSMFYYQKPEYEYYVWIYAHKPKAFLKHKLLLSVICLSFLCLPVLLALLLAFPSQWLVTLLVYFGGHMLVGSMILAKYAAFPFEISIAQGIFYSVSLLFPPLLLIAMMVFYSKSKKSLKSFLQ